MPFKSDKQRRLCWVLYKKALKDKKTPKWNCPAWEKKTKKIKGIIGGNAKTDKLLKPKSLDSLTKSARDALNTLRLDKSDFQIMGTFGLKNAPYAGDIDSQQFVYACCDKPSAVAQIVHYLQDTIRNVVKKKGYYLADLKAGLDIRYLIGIGDLIGNKIKGYKIINYHPVEVAQKVKTLYQSGLLSNEEYKKLAKLIKPKLTKNDYEEIHEILRKHFVVRWTAQDILNGYKMLPKGVRLTLPEAIQQQTVIKIDIWGEVDGRFIEMSTFIVPVVRYSNGKKEIINGDMRMSEFDPAVRKEVDKFYANDKVLKMAKRMFSLARFRQDNKVIQAVLPLLASSVGKISQIIGDADTANEMIQKLNNPPLDVLIPQFDNMKQRLSSIPDISFNEDLLYRLIDTIVYSYQTLSKNQINELVEALHEYLFNIINPIVKNYLKKLNLYPPPLNYLPK